MNIDQARRLVTLHDNVDRALANLRNANSMASDDPRAPELLSEAGDAYAEALTALYTEQAAVVSGHTVLREEFPAPESSVADPSQVPGAGETPVEDPEQGSTAETA